MKNTSRGARGAAMSAPAKKRRCRRPAARGARGRGVPPPIKICHTSGGHSEPYPSRQTSLPRRRWETAWIGSRTLKAVAERTRRRHRCADQRESGLRRVPHGAPDAPGAGARQGQPPAQAAAPIGGASQDRRKSPPRPHGRRHRDGRRRASTDSNHRDMKKGGHAQGGARAARGRQGVPPPTARPAEKDRALSGARVADAARRAAAAWGRRGRAARQL